MQVLDDSQQRVALADSFQFKRLVLPSVAAREGEGRKGVAFALAPDELAYLLDDGVQKLLLLAVGVDAPLTVNHLQILLVDANDVAGTRLLQLLADDVDHLGGHVYPLGRARLPPAVVGRGADVKPSVLHPQAAVDGHRLCLYLGRRYRCCLCLFVCHDFAIR
jgi:hypothetical protein